MEPESAMTVESAIQLRFPPFPPVPDGVVLIPFHLFRPSGIRVPIDDDDDVDEGERVSEMIECDGLGIPTVALRVKHNTDSLEKKKKRKKKGNGAQQMQVAEKPKTWWEIWEECEEIRRNGYDRTLPPVDRLFQAGVDFKDGRTWPTATQGVQHVWDIFRLYIGLLSQTPAPTKDAVPDTGEDAESDDESGDEDDVIAHVKDEDSLKEAFLNDPELSMKVFFSSHFRERGLIWSEPRCVITPILVSFFLRYLIRSRVFPEPEYDRSIKRALEIVELARIQLPNSWKLGRALPDTFSDGCKGIWSSMQTMWVLPTDASSDGTEERQAKRQKLSDSEDARSQSPKKPVEADEEISTESNSTPAGGGWGTAAAAGEDMQGWGGTENSWGDTPTFVPTEGEEEQAPPIWDASVVEPQEATWEIEVPTLLPLLGPSTFPLTHTTGVVEQSTRRIVRVEPPRTPRPLAQTAPAAEVVEEDLACRFARLVLAPWERLDERVYKAGSDVLPPTILSTSRGAVVMEEDGEEGGSDKSPSVVKAHRPWKDEIAVLVDPRLTDILITGMGIGAIWVEIVRDKDAEGLYAASPSKKGKGKSKKKEVPKYWYMEQVVHQLPSFYIDKPEEA